MNLNLLNPSAPTTQTTVSKPVETRLRFAILQSLVLVGAVLLAYLWLELPMLQPYALQGFALSLIGYFLLKRVRNAKIWHVFPAEESLELAIVTFSFLLLIGATGNTESIFFSLGYIHIFLMVMAARLITSFIGTTATLLFHLSLTPALGLEEVNTIITLPLMLLFFLFAKKQYDEVQIDRVMIQKETEEIEELKVEEATLRWFLKDFLLPKLAMLEHLARDKSQLTILNTQLALLQVEVQKLLEKLPSHHASQETNT
jgi:hypothetical protein